MSENQTGHGHPFGEQLRTEGGQPRSDREQLRSDEIDAQRVKGWSDFHPEDYCHRCGYRNVSWYTPSEHWNPVMRGGDPAGWGDWQEIICPPCFTELAARAGYATSWQVSRDEHGTWVLKATEAELRHAWDGGYEAGLEDGFAEGARH